ncbi:MAG: hypothetical protein GY931_08595 [Maribacter sp.]|nr:hypothetical protein [Maribacter sp.]
MATFIIGIIITFITLNIAAMFIGFKKDMKVFAIAAFTYGVLSIIPIPIPIIGMFVPVIGMYMVLVGTNYESHDRVMKLCIVHR